MSLSLTASGVVVFLFESLLLPLSHLPDFIVLSLWCLWLPCSVYSYVLTNKATGRQEKKGNVYLSSFLFHFYSFLALSFILSFFLFFSPSLSPHSLALSASLSVSPLFSQLFVISPCLLIYLLIIHFESLGISSLTGSRRRCQQVVARWILATSLFSHLYQSLFFLWSS